MSNELQINSFKKGESEKGKVVCVEHSLFIGLIPHPEILERYEKIFPGAAERILKMAEEQSLHRRTQESRVIGSDILNSRLGLIFALIIGLAGIIGGAVCIVNGKEVSGSIFGMTCIATLVGVFVYGSQNRRKERESRRVDEKEKRDEE